ncbi:MAG TPA: hypothetical protein VE153_26825 [Myxococcus sp.]|jgi:hypothetical protein|nr:hypothetical protein [Myxococcus sp.]
MKNGLLARGYRWLRRPRSRGQAMAEFTILLMALLIGVFGITTFAPDMFSAFTIYIRGFYLVLGYPMG